MHHRIFITGSGIAAEARELLQRHGCVLQNGDPADRADDLVRKLTQFRPHALIVRQGPINAQVMQASGELKVIAKHGVGTDNIDVAAATARGLPVFFTPRANFQSAAQHTFALMLAMVRRIPLEDRRVRSGVYDKAKYDGIELTGKTLGLVGFGKIARCLAALVAPFGVRVLAFHPSATPEKLAAHVSKMQNVEELLSRSDIVSLHCPLTAHTKYMINAASIARMKRGAFIVNTARGGLINEADLAHALREGRVRGAALDVLEIEPPAADNPLLKLDNVILTPHVAGSSDLSTVNMGMESARHVLCVLENQPLVTDALVNRDALASGRAES